MAKRHCVRYGKSKGRKVCRKFAKGARKHKRK